jgi:hypothetical protein
LKIELTYIDKAKRLRALSPNALCTFEFIEDTGGKAELVFPSESRRDSRGNVLFNAAEDIENRRRSDVEIERIDLGQYVDLVSGWQTRLLLLMPADTSQCRSEVALGDCHAAVQKNGVC